MKRKQLLIMGILSVCLLTSACGAKEQTETASQEVTEVARPSIMAHSLEGRLGPSIT